MSTLDHLPSGGISLSGSQQEALSQECCLDDCSQDSLSSGDTGRAPGTPIESIPVTVVEPMPEPLIKFVREARQEPLNTAMKEFREKWKKHHATRLETPSGFVAHDKAEQIRLEFATLVQKMGSQEEQAEWSALSPDLCDKFICHLFLPPELGGILPAYEES